MITIRVLPRNNNKEHWLGLKRGKVTNEWQWSDMSEVIWTNWKTGQPQSNTRRSYMSGRGGKWKSSKSTGNKFMFVCKRVSDYVDFLIFQEVVVVVKWYLAILTKLKWSNECKCNCKPRNSRINCICYSNVIHVEPNMLITLLLFYHIFEDNNK